MDPIIIEYPPGFDDYAWEIEAKGWLGNIVAIIQGTRYTLNVFDATRLAQEIHHDLQVGHMFVERNLVVVGSVNRASIESALEEIVHKGRVGDLQADRGPP